MLNHSSSNDRSINNQVLVEGEIYSKPKRASLHKTKAIKYPTIKLKDLVLVHDYCASRHLRGAGVVTEL